jgi:hypothetical protein
MPIDNCRVTTYPRKKRKVGERQRSQPFRRDRLTKGRPEPREPLPSGIGRLGAWRQATVLRGPMFRVSHWRRAPRVAEAVALSVSPRRCPPRAAEPVPQSQVPACDSSCRYHAIAKVVRHFLIGARRGLPAPPDPRLAVRAAETPDRRAGPRGRRPPNRGPEAWLAQRTYAAVPSAGRQARPRAVTHH